MRILITGAGFIGSHVAAILHEAGHELSLMDRRAPSNSTPHRHVTGDVCNASLVRQLVREHDAVIHLAGLLGTAETVVDPYPSVETNIIGTLNVLEACRPDSGRPAVTAALITVGNHFMHNTYAITKTAAERFALMFNREHGTRVAVVRAYNAYGEGQKHRPIRKLLPNCFAAAFRNQPIEVFGTGEQRIDLIYVRDVASVLVQTIVHPHNCYHSVFEAGTGVAVTVNEIAAYVNTLCGNSAGIRRLPMRPGEPEMSIVVADKSTLAPLAMAEAPFVRWPEGVAQTLDWYRQHLDFLAD